MRCSRYTLNHVANTSGTLRSSAKNTFIEIAIHHIPTKLVKLNKYKHKKYSWITHGLLKSIKYRYYLYKRVKITDPNSANYDTINLNLKTYNGILKTCIRAAKHIYFELCFERFQKGHNEYVESINDTLSNIKMQKNHQQSL